jgi:hypothetical protein
MVLAQESGGAKNSAYIGSHDLDYYSTVKIVRIEHGDLTRYKLIIRRVHYWPTFLVL